MPAFRALRLAFALLAAVAAAACGPSGPHAQGSHGFPPASVSTVKVEPRQFPVAFEYVGQTLGSRDVEVRARVTGIVERRLFKEGAAVKAGQPLFVIDPKPYQAQVAAADAEVARAEAQKAQADREAARLKPLAERKAIGQKEADDAASNADLAAAAVKSARARLDELRLNLGYTRVVAPIAGLTSRAQVSEGSLATANTTLLTTISQADPIWVGFSISENEQLRINRAIAAGAITLPGDKGFEVTVLLSDGTPFPKRGRINFADTRINPATGTYDMRAEIPNGDGALKPGQFVRVVLRGAERKDAIAVPQTAVLDGPQGKFVYVPGKDKDGKDVAQVRPVKVGDWVDANGSNLWVIEDGLKAGDTVIVDGIAKVMPGAPIMIAAAGASGAPGAPGTGASGAPGASGSAAPASRDAAGAVSTPAKDGTPPASKDAGTPASATKAGAPASPAAKDAAAPAR
jgi:membrane fusion protein (multidrug efflux system)